MIRTRDQLARGLGVYVDPDCAYPVLCRASISHDVPNIAALAGDAVATRTLTEAQLESATNIVRDCLDALMEWRKGVEA